MKSSSSYLSCAAFLTLAASVCVLPGCSDTGTVEETAEVAAPAPPVSVASSEEGDKPESASTGDMPDFADEPTFSDPKSNESKPAEQVATIPPPGPEAAPSIDPFRLPEPAPADETWRKEWITGFDAAKAKAQKEGKDILVNFTGSDWCTWCIRLSQEVFSRDEFAAYAKKNFVLVEADFPQNQFGEPEALDPVHQELSDQYEIQGFPTIMLFDQQGRPFGRTGYQPGGPDAYNAHLDEMRLARVDRDSALTAAEELQGIERARKLDEALAVLPTEVLLPAYESVVEEIIKLDADNKAELRGQYEDQLANHQFMEKIQAVEKLVPSTQDPEVILSGIDKVAAEFGNDPKRSFVITMFRINVLNYYDRIDDVVTFAAEALKNESLDADYKAQLYITQLRVLNQADRQEDALSIIDQAIAAFDGNDSLKMEFFIARADFLQKLNRTEEARAAVAEARKLGGPAAAFRIDQFEQAVLGSVTPGDPPVTLPEPASPAGEKKPATQAPADDESK